MGTVVVVKLETTQQMTMWTYKIRAQITTEAGETLQPTPVGSVLRGNGTTIESSNMTEVTGQPTYNWELDDECDEKPIDGKVEAIFQKPEDDQETFPFP